MGFIQRNAIELSGSVVEELRAEGISYEDIQTALDYQETQRRYGAPVLPLRVICGLDRQQRRNDTIVLDTTRALLSVPHRGGRPKGGLRITRRKIWANSVKTDSPEEADFVQPLGPDLRERLGTAADKLKHLARELAAEARAGVRILTDQEKLLIQFTSSCWEILKSMVWQERRRKGWLTPDYEAIMAWTKLSRSTVYRSLNVLKDIGLVEWIRRFNYAQDDVSGARSEQTSNLYRFTLPGWIAKRLRLNTPIPTDEAVRRDQALEDHAAMLANVPPKERAHLMPADPDTRLALVTAGLRIDRRHRADCVARECQKNLAPPENYRFSKNGGEESAWTADAQGPDGQTQT